MDERMYNRLLLYFINTTITSWNKITGESLGKPRIEKMKDNTFLFSGYVGMISFGGGASGRVLLALDEELAILVSKELMGIEPEGVTDITFAIAEFLNIVTGNAISLFNNESLVKRILPSPPGAFYGKDLKFMNFKVKGFNTVFPVKDKAIKLNIVLEEGKND